jgi:hypothetical protein
MIWLVLILVLPKPPSSAKRGRGLAKFKIVNPTSIVN